MKDQFHFEAPKNFLFPYPKGVIEAFANKIDQEILNSIYNTPTKKVDKIMHKSNEQELMGLTKPELIRSIVYLQNDLEIQKAQNNILRAELKVHEKYYELSLIRSKEAIRT